VAGAFGVNPVSGLAVMDTATDSLADFVPLAQGASSLAVNPAGSQIYVAGAGVINVVDTATDTVIDTIAVGTSANSDIAISPSGAQAYVADSSGGGTVYVIDTATDTVTAAIAGGGYRVAVDPSGSRVYSTSRTGLLSVIDTGSDAVVATVAYGQGAGGVAVNPGGTRVYAADQITSTVSVIDTGTDSIIASIPVPQGPTAVTLNSAGTLAYVPSGSVGGVSVIDTSTNTIAHSLTAGRPSALALNADATTAYLANVNVMDPGNVEAIDAGTGAFEGSLPIAGEPIDIAMGPVLSATATTLAVSPSGTVAQGTTVTLTAAVTPAIDGTVQFRDKGAALGAPVSVSGGTATLSISTSTLTQGQHVLTADFAPSAPGYLVSASAPVDLQVVAPGVRIESQSTQDGTGTVSTAPLTTTGPRLLVAFTSADGPAAKQRTTVTGAGLTWSLMQRANREGGTAEIWSAQASGPLSGGVITSTPRIAGFDQSLTVVVFFGASGIGASAAAGRPSSAASVTLNTTAPGSRVFGVGEDYTNAMAPTLGPSQSLVSQWVDTAPGETFWVQDQSAEIPAAGTAVTLDDTAPTADAWNMAVAEILAASP
jgi:YVTN family beta-propeller protein